MLGAAGTFIPVLSKSLAPLQLGAPPSQFSKQRYTHRDLRDSLGTRKVFASLRGDGEIRSSTDWSTLLSNPLLRNSDDDEQGRIAQIERRFAQRLSKTIRDQSLFRPGEKLLIAVSGGQDSVCLLRLLANLRELWNWELGIAHCDHQWSSSSQQQGSHVAQIAASLGVKYYQAATTSPVNGESLARTWRYGILQRIALRHGYTSIVTAHTASDRVETLLYNLFRGSGLHGLQSLRWKRMLSPALALAQSAAFTPTGVVSSVVTPSPNLIPTVARTPDEKAFTLTDKVALVRPLLGFTRSEIREYCDRLGLSLWPDATNMSLEIDRNRIRHELLPYLRENFNASVDKSLARCAEILHAEQQYLDSVCESILRKAETLDGDGRKLDIGIVQSLPVALQRRVLKQFVENFTGRALGFDHVERLRGSYSLSSDTRNGVNLAVPGHATIRVLKTHFYIKRTKPV